MSDVDVIIKVHTQGVQEIGNLSASLRNLSNTLRGVSVPMSKLDAHTKAVHKALGITSRGVGDHAKSIKGLIQNQRVLGTETKNIARDLNGLRNAYAMAGRESTALGRSIGVTTKELSAFSRTFRGMRLRAIGSDFHNISQRLSKLGKDAQFVGRSLMINLTLPIAAFGRIGLQNFLSIEKQSTRLIKVMEQLAMTMDQAMSKVGVGEGQVATAKQTADAYNMVQAFKALDTTLTGLSLKFGVSKELVVGLAADFAELGLTSEKSVSDITELTLQIEKLGTMDIGPAQDLSQALFFQSKRAFEVTRAFDKLTTSRQREEKAIEASTAQMYLFNAIENATALTLQDLGQAFPEIAAMATSYGLSMTEAAAMLAPMKAAGLDIGASSNSIKVSLQRLLAPTKQNIETIKKLSKQYGVAGDANDDFILSTKTGLTGLSAVVKMFDKVRSSSQGQEGALRLMSDLFEKRQGPRMYLAIEQLADFNKELANVSVSANGVVTSALTAERELANAAESVVMNETFKNFNSKIVPKTIRSFEDIGKIARVATAFEGQEMEIKGVKFNITQQDIDLAKAMRKETSQLILDAKQNEGRDIISEVQTETGRALMIQLAGASNAKEVADAELKRTLATAGTAVEQLRTTFKLFASDIVQSLIPTLKKLAANVVKMYEKWMSPEFEQTKERIIKLITVLGSLLAIMGPLTLAVGTLQSVFGKLGMGLIRFFPKLKIAEGGFVGLGQSAEVARDSMKKLYESTLRMAGIRSASPASASALTGTPLMPREVTPAIRQKMLNEAKREAMRAAGVSASQQRQAAREIKDGTFPPASGSRARSASTGRMLPSKVVEAMQIIQARDLADVTPGPTGVLRDSRGRNVSPTSKAAVLRNKAAAKIARQQEMFTASPFFEKVGIQTDRDGTQFVRKGRQITEAQAKNIGSGGIRGMGARVQTSVSGAVSSVKDAALSPITGTKKALDAARASQAALTAQMAAMGKTAPGSFRMATTGIMGFVKGLKVATIAGRILRMTLLMTGIGAIIALVAGAVFLIVKNIDKIKGSAKGMASLKNAFNSIKDAAMMVVRPIQDLFAMFGSGQDEGEKAGNGIAAAFDGLAKGIEFVAGIFKLFVEKVIQPYLYGIVNIVLAVVAIFKGNWSDAFKFLIAGVGSVVKGVINLFVGLGSGIITIVAKAITVVLDVFGKIPIIGKVFQLASAGVNKLANGAKAIYKGIGDFAIKGLDKVISLGIQKSTNKIKTGKNKTTGAATDAGEDMAEAIAGAYGNAPIEDATDKIGKAVKDGMAEKAQELYDYVVGRFGDAIKKFVSDTVKALNKQKESALKVFDIQINTLMKLEKAEESLTRTKQYETDRRKMIDDATLRQEVYRRDRALAIYEGRTDDARILDIEESKASKESTGEIASLDDSRRKDLAKENLDALREAIGEAKELASKFFDESIAKFQESAEFITRIAPVTIEQYTAQLEELRLKTLEHSDKNNVEFGNMFQKFTETIHSRMPNTVDQFGVALGAFAGPLDELVNLAMSKYGLGSDADNTVLGVTKKMSDSVIGITLGMLVDIGGVFTTEAPAVIEQFGAVTGGLTDETGVFSETALGLFTTLLSSVKTEFITPFQAALDAAEPMKVYTQAIIDGNTEILNSFKKTLELNPELMKKIKASLDPAILGYINLKAAADAAKDAMDDAAAGGGGGGTPITDPYANRRDASGNTGFGAGGGTRRTVDKFSSLPDFVKKNVATFGYDASLTGSKLQGFAVGGPVPKGGVLGADGLGVTGFLNAPATQGIPAILHGGEFVVNAEAVKRVGLGALAKINDSRIPKFKKGGLVGDKNSPKRTLGYTADRMEKKIRDKQFIGPTLDPILQLTRNPVPQPALRKLTPRQLALKEFNESRLAAAVPQDPNRGFIGPAKATGGFLKRVGSALTPDKIFGKDVSDILGSAGTAVATKAIIGLTKAEPVLSVLDIGRRFSTSLLKEAIVDRKHGKGFSLKDLRDQTFAGSFGIGKKEQAIGYGDLIKTGNPYVDQLLGLFGDVVLDPTTYIGAGLLKSAATKITPSFLKLGAKAAVKTVSTAEKTGIVKPYIQGLVTPPRILALPSGPKIAGELMPGSAQIPTPSMSIPTPSVERIGGAIPLPRPRPTSAFPEADISEYILHGGPRADQLLGGVLNPEFVRGGVVQEILKKSKLNAQIGRGDIVDIEQGSVIALGNRSIANYILHLYKKSAEILENPTKFVQDAYVPSHIGDAFGSPMTKGIDYKYFPTRNATTYKWGDQVAYAQNWIKDNEEIVRRLLRGETHLTGVAVALPGQGTSAYQYGGIHLVKAPKTINPLARGNTDIITPSSPYGEKVFWGIHKPIASAEASWNTNSHSDMLAAYKALIHSMIDDANASMTPRQLADFTLSQKIYGNQITPGARAFMLNQIRPRAPFLFKNPEEFIPMLEKATTKDEMLDIINTKAKRKYGKGHSAEEDRLFADAIEKYNNMINEYSSPRIPDPAEILKNQRLDSVIHSGADAAVFGVADQVGMVTYREAILKKQIEDLLDLVPDFGDKKTITDAISGAPVNRYKTMPSLPDIDEVVAKANSLNVQNLPRNFSTKVLPIETSPIKMLGEAMNSVPAASVQDAMLPVTRRSNDSIAYVRDADPLDLMGNTPFTPPVTRIQDIVARMAAENEKIVSAPRSGLFADLTPPAQSDLLNQVNKDLYESTIERRVLDLQTGYPQGDDALAAAGIKEKEFISRIINSDPANLDIEYFRNYILDKIRHGAEIDYVPRSYGDMEPGYLKTILGGELRIPNSQGGHSRQQIDAMLEQVHALLTDEKIKHLVSGTKRDFGSKITQLPAFGEANVFGINKQLLGGPDGPLPATAAKYDRYRTITERLPASTLASISGGAVGGGHLMPFDPLLNTFKYGSLGDIRLIRAGYKGVKPGDRTVLNLPYNFTDQMSGGSFPLVLDTAKKHEAIYNALANVIGLTVRDYASFFDAKGLLSPSFVPDTLQSRELWAAVRNVTQDGIGNPATAITDDFLRGMPSAAPALPASSRDGLTDLLGETIQRSKMFDIGNFFGFPAARTHTDSVGMEIFFKALQSKARELDRLLGNNSPIEEVTGFLSPNRKRATARGEQYFGSGLSIADGPMKPIDFQYERGNVVSMLDELLLYSRFGSETSVSHFENIRHLRGMASIPNRQDLLSQFANSDFEKMMIQLFEIFDIVDKELISSGLNPKDFLSTPAMSPTALAGLMDIYRPLLASQDVVGSYSGGVSPFAQRFAAHRGLPTYPLETNEITLASQNFPAFNLSLQDLISDSTTRNKISGLATPNDLFLAKASSYIMAELAEARNAPLSYLSGNMPVNLFAGNPGYVGGAQGGFSTFAEMFDLLGAYDPSLSFYLKSFAFNDRGAKNLLKYPQQFKEGGYVKGMTSTAIPAMLHGGEYVVNAKAVQQLGLPYLNMMNQVSQSQFRPPTSRVNAPSGSVTNNVSTVNIQVENFVGEEAWFESMMKEYNINVLPKNQKLAGLEQRKFSSYNGINQGL